MKKILLVFSIAGLLIACNNGTDSKTEKTDSSSTTITNDSLNKQDSLNSGPAHGMTPLDSNGRRPRD